MSSDHSSSPDIAGGIEQPTRTRERAVRSVSLFGLAPCGVWPATSVARCAVGFYSTFSPVPELPQVVCFLCHCPSGRPARVLPGALPCGVRTFLSRRHFILRWLPAAAIARLTAANTPAIQLL